MSAAKKQPKQASHAHASSMRQGGGARMRNTHVAFVHFAADHAYGTMTARAIVLLLLVLLATAPAVVFAFTVSHPPAPTTTALSAKKGGTKKKKVKIRGVGNRQRSTSGFGGAAVEDCPCGSGLEYMKCCGSIHKSADAFANATPEQIVRARYSAYAKREIDFIVGSVHPLNKNFQADIDQMKHDIEINCYDNFELKQCNILEESFEGEGDQQIAKVKFIATMTQRDSREKTAFMETSTFARAGKHIRQGAWLYREGEVEAVPTDGESDKDVQGGESSGDSSDE